MGFFGNRNEGGIKSYGSGVAYIRAVNPTTNEPTGTLSAWTQIGNFRNLKVTQEAGTTKEFTDDGNNVVAVGITSPNSGTISMDLMERDDSVHNIHNNYAGYTWEICIKGATLTYSGTKVEYWISPYAKLDGAFDYSPGAEEAFFPITFNTYPAKAALSHALPASASGTTASISSGQLYWRQDV